MDYNLITAAIVLGITLLIFTLGKSPVFRIDRAGVSIIGAALMMGAGILTFDQATQAIDFRTIVLLFAMMIVTANLKLAGFFQLMGNQLLQLGKTKKRLLLIVIFISGLLSAFFINDIVCLLFTPIVILICKRAGLNPGPYVISIATASNIGSAGTLIGNPQNILIGSLSKMPFLSYFGLAFPLAIVGLIINYFFVLLLFRKDLQGELAPCQPLNGIYHGYLVGKSLLTMIIIAIGFLAGVDTVIMAGLGAGYLLITRRLKPNKVYAGIDFNLLVIFTGLFVIIGGVEHSGLMNWLIHQLRFVNFKHFFVFSILTVVLSNIFSNVPAVLLLKYFIPAGAGHLWWAGMAVFSTLAGNLTLTGSIANLIVVESAKREGVKVSFLDYLKVGFPLTVLLVVISLVYLRVMKV
ncbi:MAG TPA: anion transporter [Bacillota bacterium]|nr:anion transporter [Bacillota bacterium]